MKKMTKRQLIEEISEQTGLRRSEAKKAVEGAMDIIAKALVNGSNVYLRGFGTFAVRDVKERKARIVRTGEACIAPAHRSVKFKPGTELKNAMK